MSAPSHGSRRRRRTLVAGLVAVVAAVAVVGLIARSFRDRPVGSPKGTVEAFLTAAVVDGDGVEACRYMTRRAVLKARARGAREGSGCEAVMADAVLRLGGRRVARDARLRRLRYDTVEHGDEARVTVSAGGASTSFSLRPRSAEERTEFEPPQTEWRIDSGVSALLPRTG